MDKSDTPISYYSNAEKDARESRTFSQIKEVQAKVQSILDTAGLKLYIAGGIVPYLLLNEESNRLHDDIDTVCRIEDMQSLRDVFKMAGLYDPNWDSMTFAKDGKDYGFEVKIDGVPFGIYPFEYKDGEVTQYSYDPYNHRCKIKNIPVGELSDYVCSYAGNDGRIYDTMSLEMIKLSKERANRPKDIADSNKISQIGIRPEVQTRIGMYTEIQNVPTENLQPQVHNGTRK